MVVHVSHMGGKLWWYMSVTWEVSYGGTCQSMVVSYIRYFMSACLKNARLRFFYRIRKVFTLIDIACIYFRILLRLNTHSFNHNLFQIWKITII